MKQLSTLPVCLILLLAACGGSDEDDSVSLTDLNIQPVNNADLNSSYSNSKPDIHIPYFQSTPGTQASGSLRDAIAYIDADGDQDTDIFMATGDYLLEGENDSILAINDGNQNFTSSTSEFSDDMPPATHARKSIVTDFNGDGLKDILVFDHGFDSAPFPGSQLKLIIQDSIGLFSWSKLSEYTGFFHGGAAADIDNDGDIDFFAGGHEAAFYINDGNANFTIASDRYDSSFGKVFSAELVDVDKDGFVDLLVGAHERDGEETSIYWGSSTGAYSNNLRLKIPAVASFGAVLDFEVEDVNSDGQKDLIINRTRDGIDGEFGFYQGRTVQLLISAGNRAFEDRTVTNIDQPGGDNDIWFPWLRAQDYDNDMDIDFFPDDRSEGFVYINDGNGNFVKTEL